MSNSLDLDQTKHFVGPDLGPNCLQRLSTDDTRGQRVKETTLNKETEIESIICVRDGEKKHASNPRDGQV